MQTSAPKPPVRARMASTGIDVGGHHRVGGPELVGQLQLAGIEIDGDDLGRAGQAGAGDGGAAHPAAAEDGHRVALADAAGEHGRPQPGHDAAAEQSDRFGAGPAVDLGALAGGHQGLLGEGPDAEGGRQRGAVGQRHLLGGVVGGEAVPGATAAAGPALAADGPPVEDHEVTGRHRGHVGTDGLHHAGRLVAEEKGEVVVDAALAVVEVGVADAAGLDAHQGLARPGVGDENGLQGHRRTLGPGHDASYFVPHRHCLLDRSSERCPGATYRLNGGSGEAGDGDDGARADSPHGSAAPFRPSARSRRRRRRSVPAAPVVLVVLAASCGASPRASGPTSSSTTATAAASSTASAPTTRHRRHPRGRPTAATWPGRHWRRRFPPVTTAPSTAWTSPALDGGVYGEPLIDDGQVLVATENDTVYDLSASTRDGGLVRPSGQPGTGRRPALRGHPPHRRCHLDHGHRPGQRHPLRLGRDRQQRRRRPPAVRHQSGQPPDTVEPRPRPAGVDGGGPAPADRPGPRRRPRPGGLRGQRRRLRPVPRLGGGGARIGDRRPPRLPGTDGAAKGPSGPRRG